MSCRSLCQEYIRGCTLEDLEAENRFLDRREVGFCFDALELPRQKPTPANHNELMNLRVRAKIMVKGEWPDVVPCPIWELS